MSLGPGLWAMGLIKAGDRPMRVRLGLYYRY